MDYERSPDSAAVPAALKIVVAGGFGVGKTTTVGAISEISPLSTEAEMTALSVGVDDPGELAKLTTTVAMDFGRVTIDSGNANAYKARADGVGVAEKIADLEKSIQEAFYSRDGECDEPRVGTGASITRPI